MTVKREMAVPGSSPSGLTYANGVIIFGEFDPGTLYAIDSQTGAQLGSLAVPGRPTGMTWDGERLWYCDFPSRMFRALDLEDLLA
jgi:outer membrane protein assembly factor BamB